MNESLSPTYRMEHNLRRSKCLSACRFISKVVLGKTDVEAAKSNPSRNDGCACRELAGASRKVIKRRHDSEWNQRAKLFRKMMYAYYAPAESLCPSR